MSEPSNTNAEPQAHPISIASLTGPVSGWGNHPIEECAVYRPERLDQLAEIVAAAPEPHLIARGLGRSYGDASLNAGSGVIAMARLDRMLAFDPQTAVLHCEAAVSLAEILDAFVPRGFFFPVSPGTKFITLGGAIAADVHGKNHHHSGSMAQHVIDFGLLTGTGELLRCSREENPDIFWATLGGMGLTGVVLDVRIRLRQVESAYMRVDTLVARDLDQMLEHMSSADSEHDYGVAWIDCLRRGRGMGRSVLLSANHAERSELSRRASSEPTRIPTAFKPRVPLRMPNFTLNRASMAVFNEGVYRSYRSGRRIVSCDRYFYPLDVVHDWNLIYGRRGVLQYQFVLPTRTSREGLVQVLEALSSSRRPSFLAVLKSFGPGDEGPLSFPREGFTLALDLPYTGTDLIEQLHHFDDLVTRLGGRVYLAKDACLRPENFREMYPGLKQFREVKAKVDPSGRFSSSQARRLGIAES